MFFISVLALITTAIAQSAPEESLSFKIAMIQQTCRRGDETDAYLCTAEPAKEESVRVLLKPIPSGPLESQAFQGTSEYLGMNVAGNAGQYLPQVSVQKSVGLGDNTTIYTLRLRTFAIGGSGKPAAFETIYFSEGSPSLATPLHLVADRLDLGANAFKQISFTLSGASGANPDANRSL